MSCIRHADCATGCGASQVVTRERQPARNCATFAQEISGHSSIWTNLHAIQIKKINAAISRQLKKISHSSALGFGNEPAHFWRNDW